MKCLGSNCSSCSSGCVLQFNFLWHICPISEWIYTSGGDSVRTIIYWVQHCLHCYWLPQPLCSFVERTTSQENTIIVRTKLQSNKLPNSAQLNLAQQELRWSPDASHSYLPIGRPASHPMTQRDSSIYKSEEEPSFAFSFSISASVASYLLASVRCAESAHNSEGNNWYISCMTSLACPFNSRSRVPSASHSMTPSSMQHCS